MIRKKNTVDGNKVGQNDINKIGNTEIKNKSVNKSRNNNINNYNFLSETVKEILNNKETNDNQKKWELTELISELKLENNELKQKINLLEHLNEMKNNVYKKYEEIKINYEKDKEKWEGNNEENLIIIKKDDNVIFELKTYLKNILKENYDKLVNSVKSSNNEFDNKTVIIINKNKGYGGKNDIDILIKKWLESKDLEKSELEKYNEEDPNWADW